MSSDTISNYMNIEEYAKVAPQYYTDEVPEILVFLLKNNKIQKLLDCGCGDGSLLYALKKRKLLRGVGVTGIDLSTNRISLVKRIDSKFVAKVDSAETLKTVSDNSIDLMVTTQVIEHVDDKKMTFSIHRVVKKGGIIYLSTVFKKWYGWYFYRHNGRWVLDPTHLREYTSDSQLLKLVVNKFYLVINKKTLQWFPIVDFILKRIGPPTRSRDNLFWEVVRSIRVPILGYYLWEIVLIKK